MSVRTVVVVIFIVLAGSLCAATAGAQLPDDARKRLDYYVGTWRYDWEVEGKSYSGTWTVNWSPDQSCLVSHWSNTGPDGPQKGTKITGWDSAKNQTVDLEFSSDGLHVLTRYNIESATVESGEGIGSTADGKKIQNKARVEKKDDSFTWILSDRVEGDNRLPDLEFAFRRTAD